MAIYSSNKSVNRSILPQKGELKNKKRRKLTSCLFSGATEDPKLLEARELLQKIQQEKSGPIGAKTVGRTIEVTQTYHNYYWLNGERLDAPETITKQVFTYQRLEAGGESVRLIQKSLIIAVEAIQKRDKNFFNNYDFDPIDPGDYNKQGEYIDTKFVILDDTKTTEDYLNEVKNLSGSYDIATEQLVRFIQDYTGSDIDGIVGTQTLSALDKILEEVKYYDCVTGQLKHDASICEDKFTVTVAYKLANVHVLPDTNSTTLITLDPENPEKRKVYVIQDINNFTPGWLYVQFDMPRGGTTSTTYGYVNATKIWKTSMPDGRATLHKIVNGDTVYEIIRDNYYLNGPNGSGEYLNDLGYELRTETNFFGWYNSVQYNQFKFYVNLLLVANNPGRINYDLQQVIYLTYSGAIEINEDDINEINPFDNNTTTPNYDYFVDQLKQVNNNYDWQTWDSDDTIILIASDPQGTPNGTNRYIWIPSKDFADRLYSYLNNNESVLANLHNDIRNAVINNWDRGYGVEIEGAIGITFGIPVHLEGGGAIHLYRKYTETNDEVVMCLRKYGTVQGGLDVGIGAGFYVGSGKKNNSGNQLGAQIRAQAQAGIEFEVFTEYEFPLWDPSTWSNAGRRDLGALALFVSLIDIAVGVLEFAAVQFVKAFSDYNIDPANYLTRCEFRMTGFVRGSAAGIAGIKMGDNNSVNYWDTNDQSTSHKEPPWHLKQILGMMNVSAGVSAGAEMATGFEYTAVYDDVCFDKLSGGRVPLTFSLSMSTDFTLLADAGANLGPLNLANFSISPFMGLKLGITYERPDLINPGAPEAIILIPDYNNLKYNGVPRIEVFAGNGNWDFYENSATDVGISLLANFGTPLSTSSLLDQIDYIYIKKRFRLLGFSQGALKDSFALQRQMRNFFQKSKYKKFGFGAGAFLDFEARLTPAVVTTFLNNLTALVDELSIQIAKVQNVPIANVDWWQVLIELPLYMSTFLSPGVSLKFKKLYSDLLAGFDIRNFSFHGELSFGGAVGFQLAAGFKAALNAQAAISITYDQQFIKDNTLIVPDDQVDLANELNGYLTVPAMRQSLLLFNGDQVNTF